jgi:hypothetical protein
MSEQELSSLMAFLPQLHAKRALQVGLGAGLSELLVNNGISHLTILTATSVKGSDTDKITYCATDSERKFNLNEKYPDETIPFALTFLKILLFSFIFQ